jgi:hypothetical protein
MTEDEQTPASQVDVPAESIASNTANKASGERPKTMPGAPGVEADPNFATNGE